MHQKLQDQTALQKGLAAQAAAGLSSLVGPGMALPAGVEAGSIEAYMSPYQQQVIDASLAEFDRNAAIQNQGLRDASYSRWVLMVVVEKVLWQAEALRGQGEMNRAQLQAQLLNQGFQQAQQARAADLTAQQGLGAYQQQIGQAHQGYEQAVLDANQVAAREAQFQPFTQIGLIRTTAITDDSRNLSNFKLQLQLHHNQQHRLVHYNSIYWWSKALLVVYLENY